MHKTMQLLDKVSFVGEGKCVCNPNLHRPLLLKKKGRARKVGARPPSRTKGERAPAASKQEEVRVISFCKIVIKNVSNTIA